MTAKSGRIILTDLNSLFDAEVMARNLPGAMAHGKTLVRSFEAQAKTGPVDLMILTNVFFADMNLACTYLQRPLFDTQDWMPRVFKPMFMMTESKLGALFSAPTGPLDASIVDPKLVLLFKERRQSDMIRKMMFTGSKTELPLTLTIWLVIRAMLHLADLLNTYIDYKDSFHLQRYLISQESRVQAYLTLTTIYYLRLLRFNKILHGVRLYEKGLTMGSELRTMVTSELRAPDFQWGVFDHARLWVLWVGAVAEQMPLRDRADPSTAWFNVNFVAMARKLGLLSWQSVRPKLELFLYDDNMQPHGSQWFFKSLSASFEGNGFENLAIVPQSPEAVTAENSYHDGVAYGVQNSAVNVY